MLNKELDFLFSTNANASCRPIAYGLIIYSFIFISLMLIICLVNYISLIYLSSCVMFRYNGKKHLGGLLLVY